MKRRNLKGKLITCKTFIVFLFSLTLICLTFLLRIFTSSSKKSLFMAIAAQFFFYRLFKTFSYSYKNEIHSRSYKTLSFQKKKTILTLVSFFIHQYSFFFISIVASSMQSQKLWLLLNKKINCKSSLFPFFWCKMCSNIFSLYERKEGRKMTQKNIIIALNWVPSFYFQWRKFCGGFTFFGKFSINPFNWFFTWKFSFKIEFVDVCAGS